MPPNEALKQHRVARAGASASSQHEDSARTRVTMMNAVQDAQRKRRKRAPLKRLATIVPVSDYRDVVG